MRLPPVSVELEVKAYNNSTNEIATLLDSTSQLDSMDVIMSSRAPLCDLFSSNRGESETRFPANPAGCRYADAAGRIVRITERMLLSLFVMG